MNTNIRVQEVSISFSWAGSVLHFPLTDRTYILHALDRVPGDESILTGLEDDFGVLILVTRYTKVTGLERCPSVTIRKFIANKVLPAIELDLRQKIRESPVDMVRNQARAILNLLRSVASKIDLVAIAVHAISDRAIRSKYLSTSVRILTPRTFYFPGKYDLITTLREGKIEALWRGVIPLIQTSLPNPEEYPIAIGVNRDGIPVSIKLGGNQQARHLAIMGATGTGKSVTAQLIMKRALDQGMKVMAIDVKNEMVERDQKGQERALFDLNIINPFTGKIGFYWNMASMISALGSLMTNREEWLISRDGKVQVDAVAYDRLLNQHNDLIMLDCALVSDLVNALVFGREVINPSELFDFYTRYLRSREPLTASARSIVTGSDLIPAIHASAMGFAHYLTKLRDDRKITPQAYDAVLGDRAPYRHLILPSPESANIHFDSAVIHIRGFGMSVSGREDVDNRIYGYLLHLIVTQLIRQQQRAAQTGQVPRWLLYVEEAHRLNPKWLESALRLFRAFNISMMIVTQSASDFLSRGEATPMFEQLAYTITMIPSKKDLELLMKALGEAYELPDWVFPKASYGHGVLLYRSGGRPAFPIPLQIKVPPDVLAEIRRVRGMEGVEKKHEL